MNIIGISINHHTAPIEMREALHLSREEIISFIPRLREHLLIEGIVISTCNRTEIFGFPRKDTALPEELQDALFQFKKVDGISPGNFRNYFSCSAVRHLFRVASGLDSLVLGDSQILSQVKESIALSNDMHFSSGLMNRVLDSVIKVGKRAISETGIGEGAVSVSYAAVQITEKVFASLHNRSALVIGAGETGELAALHLRDKGIGKLVITNRTESKAVDLAVKVHGTALSFDSYKDSLHQFDIIVSATSAETVLITHQDIASVMKKRRGTPVCILDIALPRDVDVSVRKIENVFYYDIDSLSVIIDANLKKREKEIPGVESIIMDEMITLFGWYNTLEVVPTIKMIREFFEGIRADEMEKIKHKVTEEDFKKMDEMSKRLIGRLLHNPTVRLRHVAESGLNVNELMLYMATIKDLFELHPRENSDERN